MQKYSRFIVTVSLCSLIIAFFGASTIADSPNHSWIKDVFAHKPFSLFDQKSTASTKDSTTDDLAKKYPRYAALGDSVAAGTGLAASQKASQEDKACDRSGLAYPEILARKLHSRLTFTACGGATTEHLISPQSKPNVVIDAQLDTAFANVKPDLLTLTIGANDMDWIQTISGCYMTDCATDANSATIAARLDDLKKNLAYDIESISMRSHGNPPAVVLTGYYSLGSPACLSSLAPENITSEEVAWLDRQTDNLNTTIKTVAEHSKNVRYVSIDAEDHGLCAPNKTRWVQNLADPAPFHLTAQGEQAMANAIYTALQH